MTIRIDSEEKALISSHASTFGASVSEFMCKTALECIEVELDLKAQDEVKVEFEADSVAFSA